MYTDRPVVRSSKAWTVALVSFFLIVAPPLYVLIAGGERGAFSFVKADAFLYLTIARNSTWTRFSFDGTTTTNGFHPLWQWINTAIFHGCGANSGAWQAKMMALVSLACVAGGIVAASLSVLRFTGSRLVAVMTVPGVFYFLVGSILRSHTAWADVSGMECGLSVLFGGCVLLILARGLAGRTPSIEELASAGGLGSLYLKLGLVLPWLVLARLDDVFVVPALALTALLARVSLRDRIRAALYVSAPTVLALLVYMVHSKLSAGTFLPISGMTKAGFMLPKNIYMTLAGAIPVLGDVKNLISQRQSNALNLNDNLFRGMQLLYPPLMGCAFALLQRRWETGTGRRNIFLALVGYTLLKEGYNLINVHLFHQSDWYHGFSILLVTFFGLLIVSRGYELLVKSTEGKVVLAVFLGIYVVVAAGTFCVDKLYRASRVEYDFWKERNSVLAELRKQGGEPKIISFDDGISGFALEVPAIHGFAFAADIDTARARVRSQLLHHSYARGHDILTGVNYLRLPGTIESSDGIRSFLMDSIIEDLVKAELSSMDFKLIYLHPTTGTPFIRFWPRELPNAGRS